MQLTFRAVSLHFVRFFLTPETCVRQNVEIVKNTTAGREQLSRASVETSGVDSQFRVFKLRALVVSSRRWSSQLNGKISPGRTHLRQKGRQMPDPATSRHSFI
jgi:hypothetical protein